MHHVISVVCVTKTSSPFGDLTELRTCEVILEKKGVELTIWSLAPVSKIQEDLRYAERTNLGLTLI